MNLNRDILLTLFSIQHLDCKLLDSPLWIQYLLVSSSMLGPIQADIFLESVATLIQIMDKSADSAISKQDTVTN